MEKRFSTLRPGLEARCVCVWWGGGGGGGYSNRRNDISFTFTSFLESDPQFSVVVPCFSQ